MKSTIRVSRSATGYYTVTLDGVVKAYGLTFLQMDWFQRGLALGLEAAGREFEYDEHFYSIMNKK